LLLVKDQDEQQNDDDEAEQTDVHGYRVLRKPMSAMAEITPTSMSRTRANRCVMTSV
jgi:hypothetical protein